MMRSSFPGRDGGIRPWFAGAALAAALSWAPMALADDPAATAAPAAGNGSAPATPPVAPTPAPATVHIDGFRSAHFGMTQPEVRSAIAKDFSLKGTAVKASTDEVMQTPVLSVPVTDLIDKGGPATINYIFGYKSKRLDQIHIVWQLDKDSKLTSERLVTNAKQLQNYFATAGYQILAANAPTKDGIIFFQGKDADGHATLLVLHFLVGETKAKQQVQFPGVLTLDYIDDQQKPDIYQLPAGKF